MSGFPGAIEKPSYSLGFFFSGETNSYEGIWPFRGSRQLEVAEFRFYSSSETTPEAML